MRSRTFIFSMIGTAVLGLAIGSIFQISPPSRKAGGEAGAIKPMLEQTKATETVSGLRPADWDSPREELAETPNAAPPVISKPRLVQKDEPLNDNRTGIKETNLPTLGVNMPQGSGRLETMGSNLLHSSLAGLPSQPDGRTLGADAVPKRQLKAPNYPSPVTDPSGPTSAVGFVAPQARQDLQIAPASPQTSPQQLAPTETVIVKGQRQVNVRTIDGLERGMRGNRVTVSLPASKSR